MQCSKYRAYIHGGEAECVHVPCDHRHAEEVCLLEAQPGDDLVITHSPCQKCAEKIVEKNIRRVVYLSDYRYFDPINFLKSKGVQVRKAGDGIEFV